MSSLRFFGKTTSESLKIWMSITKTETSDNSRKKGIIIQISIFSLFITTIFFSSVLFNCAVYIRTKSCAYGCIIRIVYKYNHMGSIWFPNWIPYIIFFRFIYLFLLQILITVKHSPWLWHTQTANSIRPK